MRTSYTAPEFVDDGGAVMDDDESRFTHWTGQYLGSGTRFSTVDFTFQIK